MKRHQYRLAICIACGLLLAACETMPPSPPPLSAEQTAAIAAELAKANKEQELNQALTQALDLYAQGQFAPAVAALRPLIDAPELSAASRLRALKFTAFSHCVQGQTLLCRQMFEQALQQDPGFQLADTEASHPVWGAEFKRAQRNTRSMTAPMRAADKTSP